MKLSQNLGTLLLAIWLIITGLISLLNIHIALLSNLLPLIALITGILLILGSAKFPKSLGVLLLAVWLILKGLSPFLSVHIPYFDYLVNILAIVAGILILLRR